MAYDYFTMVKIIWAHNKKNFKPYKEYDMEVSLSQNSLPEAITAITGILWIWDFTFLYENFKVT